MQDWYWYTLISYCISNNAYIGCDPPDVGLLLRQRSPADDNEALADSSAENGDDSDSCHDVSAPDGVAVCDNNDDPPQSCIVASSFPTNGFVDNLSDLTTDEESILQLDGPIDKFPRKQPSDSAQSGDQSAVTVNGNTNSLPGVNAEVAACCGAEAAASEADNEDVKRSGAEPVMDAVKPERDASVSVVAGVPSSSQPSADLQPSDGSGIQEIGCELAVADAVVAKNGTFDSVSAMIPGVLTSSPPAADFQPSVASDAQETAMHDSELLVADVVVAKNGTFDSVSAVTVVPVVPTSSPPSSDLQTSLASCVQETVKSDCELPVADAVVAENDVLDSVVTVVPGVPTSLPPPADLQPSEGSRIQESATNDSELPLANAMMSESGTLDSVPAATVVPGVPTSPPPLADLQPSIQQCDFELPVADAVVAKKFNSDFSVTPASVQPSAEVPPSVVSDIHESTSDHSTVDQLNREMTDTNEAAVSRLLDEPVISADATPQCLGQSYLHSENNVTEAAVTRELMNSDALHRDTRDKADTGIPATSAAASLSVGCSLDPLTLGIIDSVEKSLTERPKTDKPANGSESDGRSQHEVPAAPVSVELQRKISRQMEVCISSSNMDTVSGFPRLLESPGFFFFKISGPGKSRKITWSWKVLDFEV